MPESKTRGAVATDFNAILKAAKLDGRTRFTPHEVGFLTKAALSTISRWMRQGKLPALKVGNRYRYILREDLEAFLMVESSHE